MGRRQSKRLKLLRESAATREAVATSEKRLHSVKKAVKRKKVNSRLKRQDKKAMKVSNKITAESNVYIDKSCRKKNSHKEFYPVNGLTKELLPIGLQDDELCELIKAVGKLVVKVEVSMTSPHRPKFWPGKETEYPHYNDRGTACKRLGTGYVEVEKFINGVGFDCNGKKHDILDHKFISRIDKSAKTCPCKKCKNAPRPSNVWWEFTLYTATHVVFDLIEARRTSCRLFYDEEDRVGEKKITLEDFCKIYANIEEDWCQLISVSCDSIGKELSKHESLIGDLWEKILIKYKDDKSKFSFIVSHPHGLPKKVTFGRVFCEYKVNPFDEHSEDTRLLYFTPTCPGSSGALVHYIAYKNRHHHSEKMITEINHSSVGLSIQ